MKKIMAIILSLLLLVAALPVATIAGEVRSNTSYTVSIPAYLRGFVEPYPVVEENKPDSFTSFTAEAGETVCFTVTSPVLKRLIPDTIAVLDDGTGSPAASVTPYRMAKGVYQFEMPEKDVEIVAEFDWTEFAQLSNATKRTLGRMVKDIWNNQKAFETASEEFSEYESIRDFLLVFPMEETYEEEMEVAETFVSMWLTILRDNSFRGEVNMRMLFQKIYYSIPYLAKELIWEQKEIAEGGDPDDMAMFKQITDNLGQNVIKGLYYFAWLGLSNAATSEYIAPFLQETEVAIPQLLFAGAYILYSIIQYFTGDGSGSTFEEEEYPLPDGNNTNAGFEIPNEVVSAAAEALGEPLELTENELFYLIFAVAYEVYDIYEIWYAEDTGVRALIQAGEYEKALAKIDEIVEKESGNFYELPAEYLPPEITFPVYQSAYSIYDKIMTNLEERYDALFGPAVAETGVTPIDFLFGNLLDDAKAISRGQMPGFNDTYKKYQNMLATVAQLLGLEWKDKEDFMSGLDEWIDHPEISEKYEGILLRLQSEFASFQPFADGSFTPADLAKIAPAIEELIASLRNLIAEGSSMQFAGMLVTHMITRGYGFDVDYDQVGWLMANAEKLANLKIPVADTLLITVLLGGILIQQILDGSFESALESFLEANPEFAPLFIIPSVIFTIIEDILTDDFDYDSFNNMLAEMLEAWFGDDSGYNFNAVMSSETNPLSDDPIFPSLLVIISDMVVLFTPTVYEEKTVEAADLHYARIRAELRAFRAYNDCGIHPELFDEMLDKLENAETVEEIRDATAEILQYYGCAVIRNAELQNGELTMILDGMKAGTFTFRWSSVGWTIFNGSNYLAAKNGTLVYSHDPFVWTYANGSFKTVDRTGTYFLNTVEAGEELAGRPVKTSFCIEILHDRHQPKFVSMPNGTHRVECAFCGKVLAASEPCHFDFRTHRCICGALEPEFLEKNVHVTTSKILIVYSTLITVDFFDLPTSSIWYSMNDGRTWIPGNLITSLVKPDNFKIRITDFNGNVYDFRVRGGKVAYEPAPAPAPKLTGKAALPKYVGLGTLFALFN